MFIRGLTPSAKDKWLARGVEVIVYGWAVVTIFGTAFQCSLPRTWDFQNGRCFNLVSGVLLLSLSLPTPLIRTTLMQFDGPYPVSLALLRRYLQHRYRPLDCHPSDDPGF